MKKLHAVFNNPIEIKRSKRYTVLSFLSLSALIIVCSFLTTSILSPNTIPAQAETQSADVNLNISEIIALSLKDCTSGDPMPNVNIEITPSYAGTFGSNCQKVTVSTNTPGYSLLVKASGSNANYNSGAVTNALLYQNPTTITPTPAIASTSATIASPATLQNNTWGFAVENLNNFDTTYTINNQNNIFASLPTTDTQVYFTDEWPIERTEFDFYYASQLDMTTVAGTYRTDVTYTAVGEEAPEPPLTFTQISAGSYFTCAIASDDNAYCWGRNLYGQLGNGDTGTDSNIPVSVSKLTGGLEGLSIKQISAGGNHVCAIASDNNAYCWGGNYSGQLGDGDTGTSTNIPVSVSKLAGGLEGLSVKQISASGNRTCAIASDDNVYCWGRGNDYGQLGNSANLDSNVPVPVSRLVGGLAGLTVKQISGGDNHTCVIASDDNAYCWGGGVSYQLGNGVISNRNFPVPVSKLTGGLENLTVKQISSGASHTCVVASDNNAYCWGTGINGQLGNGGNIGSSIPVPVSKLTSGLGELSVKQTSVASGHRTCAIASDNNAYCWGASRLGNGTNSSSNVPIPVSKLAGGIEGLTIEQISGGSDFTCVLASDDNVYCWGYNDYGQLGNGTTGTTINIPIRVINPTL